VVYYARVVIMMYMHEPDGVLQRTPIVPATVALLVLTAFGTLYLGVLPGGVLRLAEQSVQFLFQSL
jgi:NADH:ubiquinone oxidoreductase subunit 2 (subunit N)